MPETTTFRYRPSAELRVARGALAGFTACWLALGLVVAAHLTIWDAVLVPPAGVAIVAAWRLLRLLEDRHFDRTWIIAYGAEDSFSDEDLRRLGINRNRAGEVPVGNPDAGSVDPGEAGNQDPVAPVSAPDSDALFEGEYGNE